MVTMTVYTTALIGGLVWIQWLVGRVEFQTTLILIPIDVKKESKGARQLYTDETGDIQKKTATRPDSHIDQRPDTVCFSTYVISRTPPIEPAVVPLAIFSVVVNQ
uniref:Uncharacterized protein n=1 Tax=Cacopsylla melanoneura TaxID=428564 RepID=A0A8D9ALJ0_9HEMI